MDKAYLWLIPMKLGHHLQSCDLGLTCGTYHYGEDVENAVEEIDNRNPKGDKVSLGDNRSATQG